MRRRITKSIGNDERFTPGKVYDLPLITWKQIAASLGKGKRGKNPSVESFSKEVSDSEVEAA